MFLPQNTCDFHIQERQKGRRGDKKAEEEPSHRRGLGPYRELVAEPEAKA